jgi:hypothetical protein
MLSVWDIAACHSQLTPQAAQKTFPKDELSATTTQPFQSDSISGFFSAVTA